MFLRSLILSVVLCGLGFSQMVDTNLRTGNNGTSLPGSCTVGQQFQKTNASLSSQWYLCTSTNNWTVQGGGTATVDNNAVAGAVYCPDTGTANNIACTTTTTFPAAYAAGQHVLVKIGSGNGNTGAVQISINGMAAKNVTDASGTALASGRLVALGEYLLGYDGTQFQLVGDGVGSGAGTPGGSTNSIQYNAGSSTFTGPSLPTSQYPETITQIGSAAPVMQQGMFGYAGMLMPNAKFITVKTSHLSATDVDLYTPPANRIACASQSMAYNDSGSSVTWYNELKVGGVYYEITTSTSVSANASLALSTGMCFGSTVTLSSHQGTTSVLNYSANLVEFDSTSSFIPIVVPLTTTTTTIYTASTGHSGITTQAGLIPSGGGIRYAQDAASGGARTVKLYQTTTPGSLTTSDLLDSRSVAVSTNQALTSSTSLAQIGGVTENLVVTVDSAAGHQIIIGAIVDINNAQ